MQTNQTISRRRLVAGAAWSAPAVVVAASTPALAASPTPACVTDGVATLNTVEKTNSTNPDGTPVGDQANYSFTTNPTDSSVSPATFGIGVRGQDTATNASDQTPATITVTNGQTVIDFANGTPTQEISLSLTTSSTNWDQHTSDPNQYLASGTITLSGITTDQLGPDIQVLSSTADTVTIAFTPTIELVGVDTVTITDISFTTGSAVNGQDPNSCAPLSFAREGGGRQ